MKSLDSRQSEYRNILSQLFPYVSGQTLDTLLESIDSDLTSPLRADANNPASLVVNIGPAIVSNTESNRQRSISFINNVIPTFTGGTITFPSTNGGTITASTGGTGILTLPSNQYAKVLIALDQGGNLLFTVGTPNAVLASTTVPTPTTNTLPFAYIVLFNNSGTVQNIAQNNIYQFAGIGGGSGGGGGQAQEVAIPSGNSTLNITFPSPLGGSDYQVLAQMVNETDAHPQFQPLVITNKTGTGFTVSWDHPTDTANYFIDYMIPGTQQQIGSGTLISGTTTTTVMLPIPLNSNSYVVIAEFTNLIDPNPQFQNVSITNKTNTSFTAKWNSALDTSNYQLSYFVAYYQ